MKEVLCHDVGSLPANHLESSFWNWTVNWHWIQSSLDALEIDGSSRIDIGGWICLIWCVSHQFLKASVKRLERNLWRVVEKVDAISNYLENIHNHTKECHRNRPKEAQNVSKGFHFPLEMLRVAKGLKNVTVFSFSLKDPKESPRIAIHGRNILTNNPFEDP